MKTLLSKFTFAFILTFILLTTLFTISVLAAPVITDVKWDDPSCYEINDDNETITITGVIINRSKTSAFEIPESIFVQLEDGTGKTFTVTAIDKNAFRDNADKIYGELVIPNTITSIGDNAFAGTHISGDLVIPNSVTHIGSGAFSGLKEEITSLSLPLSLLEIPEKAFFESNITGELEIPTNVKTIGKNAFASTQITGDLFIPYSVTSVGDRAFENCDKITSVTLYTTPKNSTATINKSLAVGNYAFYDCTSVTGITLGSGVTSIGNYSFANIPSLTYVNFNAVQVNDLSSSAYAFHSSGLDANGITLNIGKNVTKIPNYLFYVDKASNSARLTSIVFEAGSVCSTIGSNAFANSYFLSQVTLVNSITKIGSSAFENCYSLASVTLGTKLTSIDSNAFKNCYKLVEVYNLSSLSITQKPGSGNFGYAGAYVRDIYTSLTEPSNLIFTDDGFVLYEGDVCFLLSYVGSDETVQFPKDCNGKSYEIYEYAFYKFPSKISIVLSNGVTVISKYAFKEANINGSLVIPDSVVEIYEEAFANGKGKITELKLSQNLTQIRKRTFYDSLLIANFEIPEGITTIGDEAFSKTLIQGCFVLPEGLTSLGTSAFYDCYGILGITFPTTLKEIKNNTFNGCISMTYANLENIKAFGENSFYNCQALLYANFAQSDFTIGSKAFGNCYSLSGTIDLSHTTSVSSNAFENCKRIESFIVSDKDLLDIIKGPSNLNAVYASPYNTTYITIDGVLFKFLSKTECESIANDKAATKYIVINDTVYGIFNGIIYKASKEASEASFDAYTIDGGNGYILIDNIPYVMENNVLYNVVETTLLLYPYMKSDSVYTIPNHVKEIGANAFNNVKAIEKIVIGENVTSILSGAFSNTGLKTAFIPDSITKVNASTFSGCTSLEWVVLGKNVKSIDACFQGTTALVYSRNEFLARPSDVSSTRYFSSKSQCSNHLYGYVDDDPTCERSGYSKCTFCDKTEYKKILDHFGPIVKSVSLSCFSDGYSLVECTLCNKSVKINVVKSTGHLPNYEKIAPTSTTPGYIIANCTICYETYLTSFTPHKTVACDNHVSESIFINPTYSCKTNSLRIDYCKECGEKLNVVISKEKTPCSFKFEMRIESTCSINGQLIEKCSICGNQRITKLDLAPHNHNWYTIDGNKGYEYSECSVCGLFECNEVDYSIYDMLLGKVSLYYKTYYAPDTVALLTPIWENRDLNLTQGAVDYNVELLRDILANVKYNVTDVPVVFIEKTEGELNRDTYTGAKLYVAYMDENGVRQTEAVDMNGQIRTRGNSTNNSNKYPYNIKFSNKVDLFGMGAGKKYCLLANLYDQTLIRNAVVMDFAKSIGLDYTPEYTIVEVYYNGEYDGVYMLTTPMDIDENRIEINEDKDALLEVENKGGLFRIEFNKQNADKNMNMYMKLLVDQPEELTAEGYSSLISTFYQVNIAIFSEKWDLLQKWVDVDSVAKYYLLHEYLKEVDICYDSTRSYIKDNKLYGGPVWDFDFGLGNVASGGGNNGSHTAYNNGSADYVNKNGGAELGVIEGTYTSGKLDGGWASTTGYWARGYWENGNANGFFDELYRYSDDFIDLVSQYVSDYSIQMQLLYKNYYDEEEGITYVNSIDAKHKDQDFSAARIRNWKTYRISHSYSNTTKLEISYEKAIAYLREWLQRRHEWMISAYVDIDARP